MNPAFQTLFGKTQKGHKVAPYVNDFCKSGSSQPAQNASPKYYHQQSQGGLEREKLLG